MSAAGPLPDPPGAPPLAVVVPVRDEAGNIGPLLDEIDAALNAFDVEIVYVDDGSRDATAAELAAAQHRSPRLRVLTHRTPAGQSAALWTGVAAARASWIVTLDGDGQNDPADIIRLIALAERGGVDLVAGVRTTRHDPLSRRLSSRVANAVRSWLLGDAIADSSCGLKLFRRADYLALPRFDHMHRFLPALFQRDGRRVVTCPVGHRPRRAGRSKYGIANRLWVGIIDLLGVMWLMRRGRRPEIAE